MAFNDYFTGKNTAINLPTGEGLNRSQENMDNFLVAAQKLKYDTYKKNEDDFLKAVNIDPMIFLSKSAMETQAKMIDGFNTTWGKVMQNKGANLSLDDKVNMAAQKNYILSQQGEMKASMDRYLQDRAMVEKDGGVNLDDEDWRENGQKQYLQTGEYNYTLTPKAQSILAKYPQLKVETGHAYDGTEPVEGHLGSYRPYVAQATKEDVGEKVQAVMTRDPAIMKDALKVWYQRTLAEQEKYHNNKDSKLNAITQSYIDSPSGDWNQLVKKEYGAIVKPNTGRSKFDYGDVTATNNKNSLYDIQPGIKLGQTSFGSYLNLGAKETTPQTQQIQNYVDLDTGEEKSLNSGATFKTIGYSPDKDMVIVKLTDNVITKDKEGNLVFLPKDISPYIGLKGAQYDDFLKHKFGLYRTSLMQAPPTKGITDLSNLFKTK